jgi:hypothetical protein
LICGLVLDILFVGIVIYIGVIFQRNYLKLRYDRISQEIDFENENVFSKENISVQFQVVQKKFWSLHAQVEVLLLSQ